MAVNAVNCSVRFLNGAHVAFTNCPTIFSVKQKVADELQRFAPHIMLLDNCVPITKDDDLPPAREMDAVVFEPTEWTRQTWEDIFDTHATVGDANALARAMKRMRNEGLKEDVPTMCHRALFHLSKTNSFKCMETILKEGLGDPSAVNKESEEIQRTPLEYQCLEGNYENVKSLIALGHADVNYVLGESHSLTPLMAAAAGKGSCSSLSAPSPKTSAINGTDESVSTSPRSTIIKEHRLTPTEAAGNINVGETTPLNGEPLLHGLELGSLRSASSASADEAEHELEDEKACIVALLLEQNADVNARDAHLATPLMHAAASTNTSSHVAELLIDAGAKVGVTDKYCRSALQLAVREGNVDIAHALIEHEADVNQLDGFCCSPLITAIQSNRIDAVKTLIEHGADVNCSNKSGRSPLMLAANRGWIDVIDMLLAHGADVNAVDHEQRGALSAAVCRGELAVVDILLRAGADTNHAHKDGKNSITTLIQAVLLKNESVREEIIKSLIEAKANVNYLGEHKRSPLSFAIRSLHYDAAELLLNEGARACHKDADGVTPLMEALQRGSKEHTSLLLAHGATVSRSIRDKKNRSMAYYARQGNAVSRSTYFTDLLDNALASTGCVTRSISM